jgi:hypothetical protein
LSDCRTARLVSHSNNTSYVARTSAMGQNHPCSG